MEFTFTNFVEDIFHVVREWNARSETQVEILEMSQIMLAGDVGEMKCFPHRRALVEEGALARRHNRCRRHPRSYPKAKVQIRDF